MKKRREPAAARDTTAGEGKNLNVFRSILSRNSYESIQKNNCLEVFDLGFPIISYFLRLLIFFRYQKKKTIRQTTEIPDNSKIQIILDICRYHTNFICSFLKEIGEWLFLDINSFYINYKLSL